MEQQFDYDIFLSYRHKNLDSIITQKTFHHVESYRLPASLRRKGFRDIRRAFRDTEELPVSRILTDTIDKALCSTNCLLLVCSTDTPSSEWVDREVATFIELGRAEHIYPLLISGDPETSFPPSLKRVPDIMDRVMDARVPGNAPKKIMAKAKPELLKIIAGVTGCPLRELQREHGLRRARRFLAKALAAAAAFALAGTVSLWLMQQARNYRDRARAAERSSMQVLQELTYDLPDKLTAVPGAYSRISGILQDNARQINEILLLSPDKASAEYEVAANYEKLATAMSALGSFDEAAEYQQQAIALYEPLCQASGDNAPLASACNNYGRVLNSAGRYQQAQEAFREAVRLQRQLDDPVTLAAMLANAGANAVELGQPESAARDFLACEELLSGLDLGDYDVLAVWADCAYNYGALLYRQGDHRGAQTRLEQATEGYAALCERVDSLQNRNSRCKAVSILALCLTDQGFYADALDSYLQAIEIAVALSDGENTETMTTLAGLYNNCGNCLNMQGFYADADQYYTAAADVFGQISRKTGTASDATAYATALLNTGENAFKAGEYAVSREKFDEGLRIYANVLPELGDYNAAQYYAWASYNALIYGRDAEAAVDYGLRAIQLQPGNVLANINLGYACLYAGYYDDCDVLLGWAAGLGEGQADAIRLDIAAQERAGLYSPHTAALLEQLP